MEVILLVRIRTLHSTFQQTIQQLSFELLWDIRPRLSYEFEKQELWLGDKSVTNQQVNKSR